MFKRKKEREKKERKENVGLGMCYPRNTPVFKLYESRVHAKVVHHILSTDEPCEHHVA